MAELVKDPVCAMDVAPDNAAAQSEHNGAKYYFFPPGCKTDLDADPEKYPSPDSVPGCRVLGAAPTKRGEFWK